MEAGGAIARILKDPGNTDEGQRREENQPDPKVIWVGIKCLLCFFGNCIYNMKKKIWKGV